MSIVLPFICAMLEEKTTITVSTEFGLFPQSGSRYYHGDEEHLDAFYKACCFGCPSRTLEIWTKPLFSMKTKQTWSFLNSFFRELFGVQRGTSWKRWRETWCIFHNSFCGLVSQERVYVEKENKTNTIPPTKLYSARKAKRTKRQKRKFSTVYFQKTRTGSIVVCVFLMLLNY